MPPSSQAKLKAAGPPENGGNHLHNIVNQKPVYKFVHHNHFMCYTAKIKYGTLSLSMLALCRWQGKAWLRLKPINFMVTPCINNIQHFIFQVMHTMLIKNAELLKHFKMRKLLQRVSVYKETITREPRPVLS